MPEFYITWDNDIDAGSPHEAAQIALDMMRDPQSVSTVFHVRNRSTGEVTVVDLDPDA